MSRTEDTSPQVSRLYLYPIKGCSGTEPESLEVGPGGVAGDRRWMLVDEDREFLTQREISELAQFRAAPVDGGIRVERRATDASLDVEEPVDGEPITVTIWGDTAAVRTSEAGSAWFTEQLDRPVRLVWMPTPSRPVDEETPEADVVAFQDAYPALVISEASLEELNERLDDPVPMDRFRPTVVIDGVDAHAEDEASTLETGDLQWEAGEPCTRCVVTTIDQTEGHRLGPEPLQTLATYRDADDGVRFGMYYLVRSRGTVRVGDPVALR